MATIKESAKETGEKIVEFCKDNRDDILIYGGMAVYMVATVGLYIWQVRTYKAALLKGAAVGAANAISRAIM